jgi:lysophospholipase L1-like esterase
MFLKLKSTLMVGALLPLAGVALLQLIKVMRHGRKPAQPLRVLLIGDSTGPGIGAQIGQSLAGLLAADRPDAEVLNLSRSGARLGDVDRQLRQLPNQSPHTSQRWDLLLLHVGGNDILRGTSPLAMQRSADALLAQLAPLAKHVIWLGPPNVGKQPGITPPSSQLLSTQSVLACDLFKRRADHFGVRFVDFCQPRNEATPVTGAARALATRLKQGLPNLQLVATRGQRVTS